LGGYGEIYASVYTLKTGMKYKKRAGVSYCP
jgi:hypothetical protein